jgi:FtsZ-binding cell division protein ZapB
MAVTALEVVVPALASIITASGTILTFRWQEESKRKKDERENQITLWNKVDEIVDERVRELREDRDRIKKEADQAYQDRNRLSTEVLQMQREIAILKSKQQESELHKQQAMTRMRHEVGVFSSRNTALTAENSELKTQVEFLLQESKQLRQQLSDVQQCPN